MTMTRTRFRKLVMLGIAALAAAIVVGYAVWRSAAYISGPDIEIFQPVDGATVSSSTVEVTGQVKRVSSVSMNGYQLNVDQNGRFDERIIVFPGINFITIQASDRFGRTAEKAVEIMGMATFPSTSAATSTAQHAN
ncbi:MAG: hypothetical protein KGI49_03040 [Patescibacteria group bacterium]|nr:hypothetical protein [Patescibacteria group bacterium]